jgi:hypothetical protein
MSKPQEPYFDSQSLLKQEQECVFKFSEREEEVRVHEATLTTNDSDSDSESGNSQCGESILSSSSSSDDEDSNNVPLGDTWDQGCDFKPTKPNPSIQFADQFTSTAAQNR